MVRFYVFRGPSVLLDSFFCCLMALEGEIARDSKHISLSPRRSHGQKPLVKTPHPSEPFKIRLNHGVDKPHPHKYYVVDVAPKGDAGRGQWKDGQRQEIFPQHHPRQGSVGRPGTDHKRTLVFGKL